RRHAGRPRRTRGSFAALPVSYASLPPDSVTTLAQRACSLHIHWPRLSAVPVRTSVPCLAKRSFMSCELSTFTSSPLSFATVSRGRPLGPTTPWNEPVSNPGRPCSETVGVSGAEGTRLPLEIAIALSLPPCTVGQVASMPLNSTSACPAATAVTASDPPLYGM